MSSYMSCKNGIAEQFVLSTGEVIGELCDDTVGAPVSTCCTTNCLGFLNGFYKNTGSLLAPFVVVNS